MYFVNERIIIEENSVEEAMVELKEKIESIFKELGFEGREISVIYEDEMYEIDPSNLYDYITIEAGKFSIMYFKKSNTHQLVKDGEKFAFYNVYEMHSCAITDPESWECLEEYPKKKSAEDMVMEKLFGK